MQAGSTFEITSVGQRRYDDDYEPQKKRVSSGKQDLA
jgi:hypothetical protein